MAIINPVTGFVFNPRLEEERLRQGRLALQQGTLANALAENRLRRQQDADLALQGMREIGQTGRTDMTLRGQQAVNLDTLAGALDRQGLIGQQDLELGEQTGRLAGRATMLDAFTARLGVAGTRAQEKRAAHRALSRFLPTLTADDNQVPDTLAAELEELGIMRRAEPVQPGSNQFIYKVRRSDAKAALDRLSREADEADQTFELALRQLGELTGMPVRTGGSPTLAAAIEGRAPAAMEPAPRDWRGEMAAAMRSAPVTLAAGGTVVQPSAAPVAALPVAAPRRSRVQVPVPSATVPSVPQGRGIVQPRLVQRVQPTPLPTIAELRAQVEPEPRPDMTLAEFWNVMLGQPALPTTAAAVQPVLPPAPAMNLPALMEQFGYVPPVPQGRHTPAMQATNFMSLPLPDQQLLRMADNPFQLLDDRIFRRLSPAGRLYVQQAVRLLGDR